MQEIIAAAIDIRCVYRPDSRQATVALTITDTTPGIINALLTDPAPTTTPAPPLRAAKRPQA